MNTERFWEIIEESWSQVSPEANTARANLLAGKIKDSELNALHNAIENSVILVYEDQIDELKKHELIDFDRILQSKLLDLDRPEIFKHHGGPFERFLFARSFIVLAGKAYFEAVMLDPSRVVGRLESEEMSNSAKLYYFHKYDEEMPSSDI